LSGIFPVSALKGKLNQAPGGGFLRKCLVVFQFTASVTHSSPERLHCIKVTGVFKDLPQNTHLSFDAVMTTERIKQRLNNMMTDSDGVTIYLHLKSNANRAELTEKVDAWQKNSLPRPRKV